MKKIIYLFIIVLFASCSDDFVDILPKGKTIPENTDDLAQLLNFTIDINNGGINFSDMADDIMIPDNKISSTSESSLKAYTWQDYMYTDIEPDADWLAYYRIISRANFVLQNIDTYTPGQEFDINYTKGRALFIRANAYFYLVNAYGKHYNVNTASSDLAIPLLLEMDINASEPRSTVQQVYDQIIEDLETALPLLTVTSTHKTWSNKTSAYSLLGRVYLYQQKYQLSQEYSRKALDLYKVLTDYNTFSFLMGNNSASGIAGYDFNKFSNEENIYVQEPGIYRSEMFLSAGLINSYDKTNDLRFRYFISDYSVSGEYLDGLYMGTNSGQVPFSGIRVPEVVLNYCEALMKQSSSDKIVALEYLNMLRQKRFDTSTYSDFVSNDNDAILAEIMLERRRELRLTAFRWFDMKRLGLTASRTVNGKTYTLTGSSNNYVWAIPLYVMALNSKLVQSERGL